MNRLYLYVLLIATVFCGCYDDDTVGIPTTWQPDPLIYEPYEPKVDMVNAGVQGIVVDENGQPMVGVSIKLDELNLLTDDYGHFMVKEKAMNTYGTLATAEKDGYFKGSRRFFPIESTITQIKIMLVKKEFAASFSGSEGGEIQVIGGGSIRFEANSIDAGSGMLYKDMVQVAARWLDPTLSVTLDQMPGDLQGVGLSTEFEEVQLGTYGMMMIELKGEQGQELNIADGSAATIAMPLPAQIRSQAPDVIPVWSFNDKYGIWYEETSAIKQDDQYIAQVEHFSTWNCDEILRYNRTQFTLNDMEGIPMRNTHVVAKIFDVVVGSFSTNSRGQAMYNCPEGFSITFEVLDQCGDLISSPSSGPYSEADENINISIDLTELNLFNINGQLICGSESIDNGLMIVDHNGGESYHYIDDSQFEFSVFSCVGNSKVSVSMVDLDDITNYYSRTLDVDDDLNLGALNLCEDQVEDFLVIEVDGVFNWFDPPQVLINDELSQTLIFSIGVNGSASIAFGGLDVGDYSGEGNNVLSYATQSARRWKFDRASFEEFHVTRFDNIIIGEFSGVMTNRFDNQIAAQQLKGSFKVSI